MEHWIEVRTKAQRGGAVRIPCSSAEELRRESDKLFASGAYIMFEEHHLNGGQHWFTRYYGNEIK